jgi:hypothetical protein
MDISKSMPTVLRSGPYRFFFYSGDKDEPLHIHVERDDKVAKFWLDPVRFHISGGFSRKEIAEILKLIEANKDLFQGSWNDYFNE